MKTNNRYVKYIRPAALLACVVFFATLVNAAPPWISYVWADFDIGELFFYAETGHPNSVNPDLSIILDDIVSWNLIHQGDGTTQGATFVEGDHVLQVWGWDNGVSGTGHQEKWATVAIGTDGNGYLPYKNNSNQLFWFVYDAPSNSFNYYDGTPPLIH